MLPTNCMVEGEFKMGGELNLHRVFALHFQMRFALLDFYGLVNMIWLCISCNHMVSEGYC